MSGALACTARFDLSAACAPDNQTLCLRGGRFSVRVAFHDPGDGQIKMAHPLPLLDETGMFWFFNQSNVEVLVKVIGPANGYYWVFFGGLTDLEYTVTVTDEEADPASQPPRSYTNPGGLLCGGRDTQAFPQDPALQIPPSSTVESLLGSVAEPRDWRLLAIPAGDASTGDHALEAGSAEAAPRDPETVAAVSAVVTGPCVADATTLCLLDGRFEVKVGWATQNGGNQSGVGRAVPQTDETGLFWFFSSNNIELAVKMLDGGGINQDFWMFLGSLTDVAFDLTIRDTVTDAVRTYSNLEGTYCGQADIQAFPSP